MKKKNRILLAVLFLIAAVLALTLEVDVKFGKAAEEAWYAGDEDRDEEEDWADWVRRASAP